MINMSAMLVGFDVGHHEKTWEEKHSKGIKGVNGEPDFEEYHFNSGVVRYLIDEAKRHNVSYVLGQALDAPYAIGLRDRVKVYNDNKVHFVLSFHADYNTNGIAQGHWAFYWHNSSNSKRLANLWDANADRILPNADRNIYPCVPNTWSGFYMNRYTHMPCITIEHAFFSNLEDLKLLRSESFRKKCAETAMRTICDWYKIDYIEPVRAIDYKVLYYKLVEGISDLVRGVE